MRAPNLWKDYKRLTFVDPNWLFIWIAIYLTFLTLDVVAPTFIGTSVIKYAGIFLCIIYARAKYKNDYDLQLALLFTLLADTLLVWTPFTLAGVYVFAIAQALHIIRQLHLPKISLFIFVGVLSLIAGLSQLFRLPTIYVLGALYGGELITNIVIAAINYRKHNKNFNVRCALYGFIAFFFCDLCVAFRFVAIDTPVPDNFIPLASYLVWVFYYPSQVLIANSSIKKFAKTKRIR